VRTSGLALNAFAVALEYLVSAHVDQLGSFAPLQRLGNSGSSNSQHERKEFVRQRQRFQSGPVRDHQNRTRQALIDARQSVSGCGWCVLYREDLNEFEKQPAHGEFFYPSPPSVRRPVFTDLLPQFASRRNVVTERYPSRRQFRITAFPPRQFRSSLAADKAKYVP
jgi:hypothetical protein